MLVVCAKDEWTVYLMVDYSYRNFTGTWIALDRSNQTVPRHSLKSSPSRWTLDAWVSTLLDGVRANLLQIRRDCNLLAADHEADEPIIQPTRLTSQSENQGHPLNIGFLGYQTTYVRISRSCEMVHWKSYQEIWGTEIITWSWKWPIFQKTTQNLAHRPMDSIVQGSNWIQSSNLFVILSVSVSDWIRSRAAWFIAPWVCHLLKTMFSSTDVDRRQISKWRTSKPEAVIPQDWIQKRNPNG